MRGKLKNQIAFYAENDEGLLDELIIDIVEKEYEYNGNLDKRELWSVREGHKKEFLVEKKGLTALYDLLERRYGGTYYCEDKSYEIRQEEEKLLKQQQRARILVPKEKIWQAIKWELDQRELNGLLSYEKYRYEKSDYYDFELILNKIHAFMAGEKSVSYFKSWCVFLMRCFYEAMDCRNKKLQALYDYVASCLEDFDFMSSDISEEQKKRECREQIAYLKYYDHQITDARNGRETLFIKNGVVTYVMFGFWVGDGNECVYRVCVEDHERGAVNQFFVRNLEFNEEIDYTFLSSGEFEDLTWNYFDFQFDPTMTEEYALQKGRGTK